MSDTIVANVAKHPKLTSALLTAFLVVSQISMVAAGSEGTFPGP